MMDQLLRPGRKAFAGITATVSGGLPLMTACGSGLRRKSRWLLPSAALCVLAACSDGKSDASGEDTGLSSGGTSTSTSDNTSGAPDSGGALPDAGNDTNGPSLPATKSGGCGSEAKFATGLQSLTSDSTQRNYWVEMPANYDPNKAYPVIIGLHWRDGSAADVYGWSGFFGLKEQYGSSAIFVAPDGLDKGWANSGDRDIRFLRAMLSEVQEGVCTDTERVFATGFSFGGMMSNAVGCQMGDVVRAIVPMAGSLWSGCADSTNKVAALFIHAKDDKTVPYTAGEEARDVFLERNGCSATTVPLGSNGCVEYEGCDAGKPVVWCGTETGGHWYPAFSAEESKAFFDRF